MPHSMKELQQTRRRNLNELIARSHDEHERGGVSVVARLLRHEWPGFVSQIRGGRRAITEATARALENAFSLPVGAMDRYPLPAKGEKTVRPPSDNKLLVMLAEAADRASVHLPVDKLDAAMELMRAAERADSEYADTVVSLLK